MHTAAQSALEVAKRQGPRPYSSEQAARDEADAFARGKAARAQHAALAAEILAATGCTEDAASIAAGSYINFRNMPDFGLSDPPYGWYARHTDALIALRKWLASVSAAQAKAA